MLPLQTIEVNPGAEARATIVILHGLGADGTDFLSFADEMKLVPSGRCAGSFRARPNAR